MAFMRPFAEKMTVYVVDTNAGTYNVPEEALSSADFSGNRVKRAALLKYTEGSKIYSVKKAKGWFSRLSAPGYMDATEWDGPHKSRDAALDAVKKSYDVDDEGDNEGDY